MPVTFNWPREVWVHVTNIAVSILSKFEGKFILSKCLEFWYNIGLIKNLGFDLRAKMCFYVSGSQLSDTAYRSWRLSAGFSLDN